MLGKRAPCNSRSLDPNKPSQPIKKCAFAFAMKTIITRKILDMKIS